MRFPLMTSVACPALLLLSATITDSAAAEPATPEAALQTAIAALAANDIGTFLTASQTPESLAALKQGFEAQREAADEMEIAQVDGTLQMLIADGAEDILFQMIQPQLAETQGALAMAPMMLGMALAQASGNGDPTAQPDPQSQALMQALGGWITTINLNDEEKIKQAIGLLCNGARAMEVSSAADLQQMDFDTTIGKTSHLLQAAKEVLALYGLDLQASLESFTVGEAVIDGDSATVPFTFTILDVEMSNEAELTKHDSGWYPAVSPAGYFEAQEVIEAPAE